MSAIFKSHEFPETEKTNECLDNLILSAASSVDWRIYGTPRCRGLNPPFAGFRSDLSHLAFCDGQTHNLDLDEDRGARRVLSVLYG